MAAFVSAEPSVSFCSTFTVEYITLFYVVVELLPLIAFSGALLVPPQAAEPLDSTLSTCSSLPLLFALGGPYTVVRSTFYVVLPQCVCVVCCCSRLRCSITLLLPLVGRCWLRCPVRCVPVYVTLPLPFVGQTVPLQLFCTHVYRWIRLPAVRYVCWVPILQLICRRCYTAFWTCRRTLALPFCIVWCCVLVPFAVVRFVDSVCCWILPFSLFLRCLAPLYVRCCVLPVAYPDLLPLRFVICYVTLLLFCSLLRCCSCCLRLLYRYHVCLPLFVSCRWNVTLPVLFWLPLRIRLVRSGLICSTPFCVVAFAAFVTFTVLRYRSRLRLPFAISALVGWFCGYVTVTFWIRSSLFDWFAFTFGLRLRLILPLPFPHLRSAQFVGSVWTVLFVLVTIVYFVGYTSLRCYVLDTRSAYCAHPLRPFADTRCRCVVCYRRVCWFTLRCCPLRCVPHRVTFYTRCPVTVARTLRLLPFVTAAHLFLRCGLRYRARPLPDCVCCCWLRFVVRSWFVRWSVCWVLFVDLFRYVVDSLLLLRYGRWTLFYCLVVPVVFTVTHSRSFWLRCSFWFVRISLVVTRSFTALPRITALRFTRTPFTRLLPRYVTVSAFATHVRVCDLPAPRLLRLRYHCTCVCVYRLRGRTARCHVYARFCVTLRLRAVHADCSLLLDTRTGLDLRCSFTDCLPVCWFCYRRCRSFVRSAFASLDVHLVGCCSARWVGWVLVTFAPLRFTFSSWLPFGAFVCPVAVTAFTPLRVTLFVTLLFCSRNRSLFVTVYLFLFLRSAFMLWNGRFVLRCSRSPAACYVGSLFPVAFLHIHCRCSLYAGGFCHLFCSVDRCCWFCTHCLPGCLPF